jgi:hypothetical protein
MTLCDYLKPLGGRDNNFLLQHFCASIAGHQISVESLFTQAEQDWMFLELSRRAEADTAYAPGERMTWRREHLDTETLSAIRQPRIDNLIATRLRERTLATDSPMPMWPSGQRFALCITHDVDHVSSYNWREGWRRNSRASSTSDAIPQLYREDFTKARAMRGTVSSFARKYALRSPDRLAGISEWMKIEDGCGFKSTFYFFASQAGAWHWRDCNYAFSDKVPFDGRSVAVGELMRRVAEAGWEIGLHPSYYAATSPEWLRIQKELCEDAIQGKIVSVRQHTLQYDPNRTPAFQAQAGLSVDSTQGFNDLIGFRAGTSFPYLCWDWVRGATLPLLEVPLHIQDGPLLRDSPSTDKTIENAISLMKSVEDVGGVLVILWHPSWLATDSGLAVFKTILEEAKFRNAWGCSVQQLATWWLSRTDRIMHGAQASELRIKDISVGR